MVLNLRRQITHSENKLVNQIVCLIREFSYFLRFKFAKSHDSDFKDLKGKRKCIVCMAADYGNLGDVAITYAQEKFLSEKFPNYEIVDFPISKTLTHLKSLKRNCTTDDIITLVGGGFMGDLYFRSELLRQLILKVFKSYRIISFPQTADFSESQLGKYMLRRAEKIYSKCKRLELWAREERSYYFMQVHFPKNHVRLTPDIVMTLNELKRNGNRDVVTFCVRNDKEKNVAVDAIINKLEKSFRLNGKKIEYYDTHIGNVCLDLAHRVIELEKIWEQFRRSQLVVTDRLHGMIFAYITGTPAIVLQNNNFKIAESYKWICNCGYVYLQKDSKDVVNNLIGKYEGIEKGFVKTHRNIIEIFDKIELWL